MLSNAYFLAKFRFDAAENEPAKHLQILLEIAQFCKTGASQEANAEGTSNGPQDGRDGSHTDDAKEQLDTQASAQRTAYLCKKKDNKLSNWMQNIFAILYIFRQAMLTPRKVH